MTPEVPPLEAPAAPGMREGWAPSLLVWDAAGGKRLQRLQERKRQNYTQWRKPLDKAHPGAGQRGQGWNDLELGGLARVGHPRVPQSNSHSQGNGSDPDTRVVHSRL